MKNIDRYLLLKYKSTIYRLFKFTLKMHDGSAYFFDLPGHKGIRISYHTTGQINYHFPYSEKLTLFAEPTFNITKSFGFLNFTIPSFQKLAEHVRSMDENCYLIDVPHDADERCYFTLVIRPVDSEVIPGFGGVGLKFKNMFELFVVINGDTFPVNDKNRYVYRFPDKGVFSARQYEFPNSMLLFHQKINGLKQKVILYPPDEEGIFKVYFAVPMFRAPDINIVFKRTDLKAIMLDEHKSNAHIRFRVKDSNGNYVKTAEEILNIELDARL